MKRLPTHRKLRGSYYTPKVICDFLASWAITSSEAAVLEPSCGDGAFIEAAIERLLGLGVTKKNISKQISGVEYDQKEALKAIERLEKYCISQSQKQIHIGDFFAYCVKHLNDQKFDAIIGNPPFIRYQYFPEEHRVIAFQLMKLMGLRPNRLTNVWVPFLVASALLLKKHGRLAMVIPAELLQVNYAADLRYFLSNYYSRITIFTFKKLLFDDIQQEVVLFTGERDGHEKTGITIVELNDLDELSRYKHTSAESELKLMDHSTEKWTQYYLTNDEIHLVRKLRQDRRLCVLGDIAEVDVGVVTGMNDFFVLSKPQTTEYRLDKYTQRVVGRSGHLQGIIFSEEDFQENIRKKFPAFLLDLPPVNFDKLPKTAQEYVLSGEKQSLHKGYKCSIRKLWYIVPSVWVPDAFMLRQIHYHPKIVLNDAKATCTDTIHRVRFKNSLDKKYFAGAFLNSLTFSFSEIIGRSYGGGVLELEPNEAVPL
jgi:adenine-specific DNA-methyltransferase